MNDPTPRHDPTPRPRRSFGEWLATKLAGETPTNTGPVRDVEGDALEVTAARTVVSFWAPWCGPCRTMRPLIDELAAEHDHDDHLEFVRVNVDTNPALAQRFNVMSVPTLVVVDTDGTEQAQLPGLVPKRQIDALLDALR